MRDPCPGYRFDIITGEKVSTNVKAGGSYVKGSNDYAVNVPLSVSGLGVSQPRGIVLEGVSTGSARLLRENCRTHVRTGLEPKERFEMPYTSAMEIGFNPGKVEPPSFGRKSCQETTIEEHQMLGPRMP
eukprot:CAMPEP_0196571672 /NCGR_PEP_ID=MMETSP1081-20130531/1818_1 /TAXON_ID=36882 /ORGANISM="Pyramimonas amylifera, Strain CCMP720" /LENGTH=128 /DNA_ID=CAMNT_0041888705 /DNA_START=380 /DNA_END=766 /DNA_ORIENTATION=+